MLHDTLPLHVPLDVHVSEPVNVYPVLHVGVHVAPNTNELHDPDKPLVGYEMVPQNAAICVHVWAPDGVPAKQLYEVPPSE
jgi:hypothetical protein